METLDLKTNTKPKVEESTTAKKTKSISKTKEQKSSNTEIFDLAEYLRNSKEYVLGHAAFTK